MSRDDKTEAVQQHVRSVLSLMEQDIKGSSDKAEPRGARLTPENLDKIAKVVMHLADGITRNGRISISEMRTFLRGTRFESLAVWLSKTVKTKMGRRANEQKEEPPPSPIAESSSPANFGQYDTDRDGQLGLKELKLAIKDWLGGSASAMLIQAGLMDYEDMMAERRSQAKAEQEEVVEVEDDGPTDKQVTNWLKQILAEKNERRRKNKDDGERIFEEEVGSTEDEAMSKTLQTLTELEHVFSEGGRSGPGGLEVDEFIAAYKQMGIDDPVGLTEMFDKIDVNDDGTLEWREFINYMLYSNMAQLSMQENNHSEEYIPKPLPSMSYHRKNTMKQLQKLRYIEREGVLISLSKEGSFQVWGAGNLVLRQTVNVGNFALTDVVAAEMINMLVVCSIEGGISFYRFDNLNMRMHRENIAGVPLCVTTWMEGGISPNQHVAVGDDRGEVHIWRYLDSDKLVQRTRFKYKVHTNWVTQLMYVPSLQYLVSSSQDSKISLYNLASQEEVKAYTAHSCGVNAFAYSAMYRTMFSVGAERAVYVWDVYGCTTVTKMLGHTAPIINVTIREHFNQLVTQSTDWVVRIWDAQLYHPVQTIDCELMGLQGQPRYPLSLVTAFGKDDIKLNGAEGSSLIVCTHCPFEWPMRKHDKEGMKITSHDSALVGVVYIAQWKQVVSVSADSVVNVWDLETGLIIIKFMIDTKLYSKITSVHIDHTCRKLITGHQKGIVCMWNTANGECLGLTACGKMPVTVMSYMSNPDDGGMGYMWVGGTSEFIHGFKDIVPAQPHTRSNDKPRNHPGDIMCMATLGGEYFLTACNKGIIHVWTVRGTLHCTCKLKKSERPDTAGTVDTSTSEQGRRDLVYMMRKGAKLSELEEDAADSEDIDYQVYSIERCCSLRNHGNIFVSCGSDGELRFWDYGQPQKQLGSHLYAWACDYDESDNVSQLAVNSTQDMLITSNEDGLVKVWSIAKLNISGSTPAQERGGIREITSWRSHSLTYIAVLNGAGADSSDMLVTLGHDWTVAIWTIRGSKVGVFGQWKPWSLGNEKSWIPGHPRIALSAAKSNKAKASAHITNVSMESDKKTTQTINLKLPGSPGGVGGKPPLSPQPPPMPRDTGEGSRGSHRAGSRGGMRAATPRSKGSQTARGTIPLLPPLAAGRNVNAKSGAQTAREGKPNEDAEAAEDAALLASLNPAATPKVESLNGQNKDIVERFLQRKTERTRNHIKEIARSRYTGNYCAVHALEKVPEEFGPRGYVEDKKRGKRPFITIKRERQLKALKDSMEKAIGSSRRREGLLGLHQENSIKMTQIENDVKLSGGEDKTSLPKQATRFWVPLNELELSELRRMSSPQSPGMPAELIDTSREIHLLPVFRSEVATNSGIRDATQTKEAQKSQRGSIQS